MRPALAGKARVPGGLLLPVTWGFVALAAHSIPEGWQLAVAVQQSPEAVGQLLLPAGLRWVI